MTGPRMTDADLFEALNLDYPGMGKVKEAIGQNNMPTAKQALATYYRLRETPLWPGDDRSDGSARYNMPPIEEAMSRTVTVMDATHSFGAGNPINWFHNPTGGDSGLAFNPEWTLQLSRHGAFGRHHITDPGSYRYERSKWRSHIKTPFAHNTVIVDGEGRNRWRSWLGCRGQV